MIRLTNSAYEESYQLAIYKHLKSF